MLKAYVSGCESGVRDTEIDLKIRLIKPENMKTKEGDEYVDFMKYYMFPRESNKIPLLEVSIAKKEEKE